MAQDERAVPITRVIAERVIQLRQAAGWSQGELAERVRRLGPTWNRSTVVKLEHKRRESVTVQELLALALVFDVPLVWLLADPRSPEGVPIAPGVEPHPWKALQWMIGEYHLGEDPERLFRTEWTEAQNLLYTLGELAGVEQALTLSGSRFLAMDDDMRTEHQRGLLLKLQSVLGRLVHYQVPIPIPDEMAQRAAELGIELPGQKAES